MGVSTPALPSVEYDDINPGMGTLNKEPKSKVTSKRGIHFNPGDVLFGKLRPYLKNWLFACFEGVAVGDFWVLTSSKIDHGFTYSLIQAPEFQYIANLSSGSKMPRSDWGLISNARTFIPTNLSEQKSISSVLFGLDTAITLHEEKKRQLERLKSALLQKMFADKNRHPAVRFKGFSDEWEQYKLGDISSSYSGGTPKAGTRKYYNGKIPFIRSGEISNDFTELTITEDGLRNSAAKMVGKGDILYALYGATSGEVSIARINGAINQAIMAIKPFEGYDSYLLASLLQNNKSKITEKYLQGGQGNLSATIVKNLKIKVPSSKEQKLIGILLLRLDCSITLYEQKLELLKRLKCSLLQNMFI